MPKKVASSPSKFDLFKKAVFENIGLSPTEIANRIYDCKDRHVARVIASQNFRKLNLTFNDLMERKGLTDEQDIDDLKRFRCYKKPVITAYGPVKDKKGKTLMIDDSDKQFDALVLTFKLKGKLKESKNGNANGNNYLIFGNATFQQLQTLPTDELITRLAQELAKR